MKKEIKKNFSKRLREKTSLEKLYEKKYQPKGIAELIRELDGEGWSLQEIMDELGCYKSEVKAALKHRKE